MTDLTKKRFAQLGQQLQVDQLAAARQQAEGWRNGLAGLTGLVGAVFVIKGRESVAGLPTAWRWSTAALLVAAFALLLAGALSAVRAAHGRPGAQVWLTGDRLFAAVLDEVERTHDALTRARRASVAGLVLVVAAVAVSWVGPAADEKTQGTTRGGTAYVRVTTVEGRTVCGEFVMSDMHGVTLRGSGSGSGADGVVRTMTARTIRTVVPVASC
ncbi:hypothetical protein G3I40_13950 [Streptomyces sp. SID14478]|uniref:hypothetical protein n=1 Tax=Streptomyces sp. SID14478 TaxID=2706073 RepID=UPI0013DA55EC|nr:hypothetical protein [Streptomyces sp. SID14478]NEB76317.1 hypothetical protein [Streptomyces sp. SID14478]